MNSGGMHEHISTKALRMSDLRGFASAVGDMLESNIQVGILEERKIVYHFATKNESTLKRCATSCRLHMLLLHSIKVGRDGAMEIGPVIGCDNFILNLPRYSPGLLSPERDGIWRWALMLFHKVWNALLFVRSS
jgi:hypothetical protein